MFAICCIDKRCQWIAQNNFNDLVPLRQDLQIQQTRHNAEFSLQRDRVKSLSQELKKGKQKSQANRQNKHKAAPWWKHGNNFLPGSSLFLISEGSCEPARGSCSGA